MNRKCLKCGGEMDEGITKAHGVYAGPTLWGTSYSIFWGTIKNSKPTVTYRCQKCGYLESYAK